MRKLGLILSLVIFVPLVCFSQESVTITTYYPSPSGAYKRIKVSETLKLEPHPAPGSCQEGELVYVSGVGLQYCDNTPAWQLLGPAQGGGGAGLWSGDISGDIANSNTGNVGIGIGSPVHKLHVVDDDEGNNLIAVYGRASSGSGGFLGSWGPRTGIRGSAYDATVYGELGRAQKVIGTVYKYGVYGYQGDSGNTYYAGYFGGRVAVVDGADTARLGIGTSPTQTLDVNGNAQISGNVQITGNTTISSDVTASNNQWGVVNTVNDAWVAPRSSNFCAGTFLGGSVECPPGQFIKRINLISSVVGPNHCWSLQAECAGL